MSTKDLHARRAVVKVMRAIWLADIPVSTRDALIAQCRRCDQDGPANRVVRLSRKSLRDRTRRIEAGELPVLTRMEDRKRAPRRGA